MGRLKQTSEPSKQTPEPSETLESHSQAST